MYTRTLKTCISVLPLHLYADMLTSVRFLELETTEFVLGSVIDAVVSQVMLLLRERGLQLIRDIPEEVKTLVVYGDQVRVQQILADFLLSMVRYAPSPEGWVEIQFRPSLKEASEGITILHIEFRQEYSCFVVSAFYFLIISSFTLIFFFFFLIACEGSCAQAKVFHRN